MTMFVILGDTLGWIPFVLRLPLLGFLSVVALVALIKLVSLVLSIIATALQLIIPWK